MRFSVVDGPPGPDVSATTTETTTETLCPSLCKWHSVRLFGREIFDDLGFLGAGRYPLGTAGEASRLRRG